MRYTVQLGLAVLLLTGLTMMVAPSASASCVPEPGVSPHAFAGTVLTTSRDGRVAEVRTDAGQVVEVVGTPAAAPAVTSVDRTYEAGIRYEFHPLDAVSPFDDNACTATRPLPPLAPAGTQPGRVDTWPGWVAAVGAITGALAAAVVLRRRRAARSSVARARSELP